MDRRSLGRENKIVLSSFGKEELAEIWKRSCSKIYYKDNSQEPAFFDKCWLWTGSTQNGYPCISQGHAKSKLKVHMLACYIRTGGRLPKSNEVVSHLCHRKLCINPNHVIIETITQNNKRKSCLRAFKDPDTDKVWNLCYHTPQCLRRDTENLPTYFTPSVIYDPQDFLPQNSNWGKKKNKLWKHFIFPFFFFYKSDPLLSARYRG